MTLLSHALTKRHKLHQLTDKKALQGEPFNFDSLPETQQVMSMASFIPNIVIMRNMVTVQIS